MSKLPSAKLNPKMVMSVLDALVGNTAHVATLYVSPFQTLRATRRWYKPKTRGRGKNKRTFAGSFNDRAIEIELTIGPPNYLEREFVKTCRKVGEPFPVKKIQLKFPPQRKPRK